MQSFETFNVIQSWEFEVGKVYMANACVFSQFDFQGSTFYLTEQARKNAVVEALAEYLVMFWVLKAHKDHHSYLLGFQIIY
jgi:ferritin